MNIKGLSFYLPWPLASSLYEFLKVGGGGVIISKKSDHQI